MPNLIWELGADSSSYRSELSAAETATTKGMKNIGDAAKASADKTTDATKQSTSALSGLGEVLTATFVASMGKKILDNAEAVVKMARNLTIGTDALQAFQYATREAGGTTDNANKIFETTRGKLDELRAGAPAAIEAFASLGLSAKDFVGLSLDQVLEKVARGYMENSDRAGAYAAVQTIVGKGGKDTMTALQELGERGFGALISGAKEAHAVISETTLKDLAAAQDNLEKFKNSAMVGGSFIADVFMKIGSTIGAVAGSFWELGKAFAAGGPFTAAGRQQMRDARSAYSETFDTIWSGASKVTAANEATKKTLEGTLPPLVESKELTAERAKFEELLNRAAEEGLDTQSRIALLRADIAKHYEAAKAAGADEVKMQKEMNLAAAAAIEVRKLLVTIRTDELKTGGLLIGSDKTQVEIAKLHLQVLTGQTDTTKILAEQKTLLARVGQGMTVDERVRLDVLTSQLTPVQLQKEAHEILAKGVANLTVEDKIRLAVLAQQTTATDTQAKASKDISDFKKMALDLSPAQLAAEEQMVKLAILEAKARGDNTDELEKQLAVLQGIIGKQKEIAKQVDGLIAQWEGYQGLISGSGDYAGMSTAMLQGIVAKEQAVMAAQKEANLRDPTAGANILGGISADPYSGVAITDVANLAGAQKELATREKIQNYVNLYGESAAQGQFGDSAVSRAMSAMATQQTRATAATIAINEKLTLLLTPSPLG